jgi:hypothetical protein
MNDFDTGSRYPALSAIVVVIKVVAVLVAVIGVIAALLAIKSGYGIAPSIGIMVGVVVAFVIMWAGAESVAVMIDIEANTRASAIAAMKAPQEPAIERIATDGQERLPPFGAR